MDWHESTGPDVAVQSAGSGLLLSAPVAVVAPAATPLVASGDRRHGGNERRNAPTPLDNASFGTTRTRVSTRDAIYRAMLMGADMLAAGLVVLVASRSGGVHQPGLIVLLALPVVLLIGKPVGVYDREEWLMRKSTLDEAPRLFQCATLFTIVVWLLSGVLDPHLNHRPDQVVMWPSLFVAMLLFRALARWGARHLTVHERCLVVGDERTCERMRAKLGSNPNLHARVVAQIALGRGESSDDVIRALADRDDLRAVAENSAIDRIIVAPERVDSDEVLHLLRVATSLAIKVSIVPRVLEVIGSSAEFDEVEGIPLLSVHQIRLSRWSYHVKRALDVAGASVAVVLLAPFLAAIAVAIKLDSRGTVLFRQGRIGRGGKPFEMLKFRTMVEGAHAKRSELFHLNQSEGLFKIEKDPRITRVGAWLRRTSLDELPQLFNVLRGDMSLVGPRPLIVEEDSRIQGWDRRRLQLTPGMTGHWQILGSARIPLNEMVKIDYLYVTNWSLWLDVKILLRTVAYVVARKGM